MTESFSAVWHRRTKYFLSPQLDLYKHIAGFLREARVILDYGCGNGAGTVQLAGRSGDLFRFPLGVDSDEHAVRFARDVFGTVARFEEVDLDRTPAAFGPGVMFDAVVCIEVLEHVKHPVELSARLASLVRPGGVLVASTINCNASYRKNEAHEEEYSPAQFLSLFPRGARLTDFTLGEKLEEDSTKTPIVCIWERPDGSVGGE